MKHIYQLKIKLRDSHPDIWRSIQVAGETTFSELHDIIQLSMGWESEHLYEFTVNNIRIYDFQDAIDDGANPSERDSMDTFLDELVNIDNTRFTYVYDFGDHWEHEIHLEKLLTAEESQTYPVCLDGERACPPEDCGGIWHYQEILGIMIDKDHQQYGDITEWMGEDWDAAFFDVKQTNKYLKDYAEQWEEIYKETGEMIDSLEGNEENDEDLDKGLYSEDEGSEYDELKEFSGPEDVLLNKYERSYMEAWLKPALEEPKSIEHETFERLRNLGFDENKSSNHILEALSVEWYYDLKYGTDHLEDRYAYNLQHLPETPIEFPRLQNALTVLDNCIKGVPFSAIEYLQNNSSNEAISAILKALENHSDHQYCWADCTFAPFWYALAAEGHLCEELIDPVIRLYEENANDSDWLHEQGQYLIGKLAQKYPDLTAQKVLEAMERDVDNSTKPYIFFLFDTFYFCDISRYKSRLLALLERDELSWYDTLAATIADFHITEGLPVLKKKLEKLQTNPDINQRQKHAVIEIEEAIRILEGEIVLDQDDIMPLSLMRKNSWKDNLKENEHFFYEDEYNPNDFNTSDLMDQSPTGSIGWPKFSSVAPFIKEKAPGRNDPCPCGSGKKYKKCCMDKDR